MANAINYIIVALICIVAVHFVFTSVIYAQSSPNVPAESIVMFNGTYNNTAHGPIITVHSVSNATYTFLPTHYSYNTTSIKLITNASEANSTYNVNYDYESDPMIMGVNFGFIIIFLAIGVLAVLVRALTR